MDEHRAANLAAWEERAPLHAGSVDYRIERLVAEPDLISPVVAADRARLGNLSGLDAVHLQCHIGTDTVSLARLGTRVVGVDFSEASLEIARRLALDTGADATFVRSEVYEAPTALEGRRFDLVYTGTGALNWLPDIRGWAEVVALLLRPGGRLLLREGHPVLWALDDERDDRLLVLAHPYFETVEPQRWESDATYVDVGEVSLANRVTYEWNHGLGETVQALLDAGLVLTELVEHTEVHWPALPWIESLGDGRFALPEGRERLPLSYTLQARAPEAAPPRGG